MDWRSGPAARIVAMCQPPSPPSTKTILFPSGDQEPCQLGERMMSVVKTLSVPFKSTVASSGWLPMNRVNRIVPAVGDQAGYASRKLGDVGCRLPLPSNDIALA